MRLPFLISVPHGGLEVPPEAKPYCRLTPLEIAKDGDEGASEIYRIGNEVAALVSTPIARAIVDMNRPVGDRSRDGVVKTHTCWNVPVYDPAPPEPVFTTILDRYYHPYHDELSRLGNSGEFVAGLDCHTMAAEGPPVGPDPGAERPWICLSNADGTCSRGWIEALRDCFSEALSGPVRINEPFRGGYITRTHASEMPWLQIEISRQAFLSISAKQELVLGGLARWSTRIAAP